MSSSIMHQSATEERPTRHIGRRTWRRAFVWLFVVLLFVGVISTFLYARAHGSAVATFHSTAHSSHALSAPMQPADWFIRSIVTGDGALGWHQLCPNIQAELPLNVLIQQASAEHATAAREGVWPTVEPLGTHTLAGVGVYHMYRVIAHWPNGTTAQEMFSVLTQPSGCVEDVQTS